MHRTTATLSFTQTGTDTTEVGKLCDRWGLWLQSGDNGRGASQCKYDDPENRGGFSPGYEDPTAEAVDLLICSLAEPMKDSIIACYYWGLSIRLAAMKLNTTCNRYRQLVDYGLQRMDAHIVAVTGRPVDSVRGLEGVDLFPHMG